MTGDFETPVTSRVVDVAGIAVVGMACRFPGGIDSPDAYWQFLLAGGDACGEVPAGRWDCYASGNPANAAAMRTMIRAGSYLDDIASFDAEFFGVSPREAELIDPQQRITLEVAWEALEHAGIPATRLAGGDGAVFMGVCCDDYGRRMLETLPRIEAWMGVGSSMCAVANRVSYVLDLRGPSVSVDTACSASLVAVHQACQALRLGETSLALAGGVMLAGGPSFNLVLAAAGAISPDGRSKSFDASADGYGRGEGCGVLVLKRLADARRDGDTIHAVIRGSAVCQDGRTDGIMAPSQEAQERMLRQACRSAGVEARSIGYVEAHGTGTRLGDPIEAAALATVLGAGRAPDDPCLIGSVKTNIGHLEAASGVAGLIKAALALRSGTIPATLVSTVLSPAIPWETSRLSVVTEARPWPAPAPDQPHRALVSNYGYGGTIAAVVLEAAPVTDVPAPTSGTSPPATPDTAVPRLYPLSAATPAGVRGVAGRLADWLGEEAGGVPNSARPRLRPRSHRGTGGVLTSAKTRLRLRSPRGTGGVPTSVKTRLRLRSPDPGTDVALADIGHTLSMRRSHLDARAVVVAGDPAELAVRLRALAEGRGTAGVSVGRRHPAAGRGLVWVFSGHGAQWSGMGRELLRDEPEFARVLAVLEPIVAREMGFSLRREVESGEMLDVARAQAMIFAMQVGLGAVWRSYGIEPAAVIGHSVGEVAAAVTAGMVDLAAATTLICRRSLLLRRVAGRGAMAMVGLPFEETVRRLPGHGAVSAAIAAAPASTVVSGEVAAVSRLVDGWRAEGIGVRRVNSDVAFHSAAMDELTADLTGALADLAPAPARIPAYTTALADPRSDQPRDAAYWVANLRDPVRFAAAVGAAAADGFGLFLEISAHPVVAQSVTETLDSLGMEDAVVAHSLRRNHSERATLLDNLGALYCQGAVADWRALHPRGGLTDLPVRAWQHRRYWFEPPAGSAGPVLHDPASHTLLGSRTIVHGAVPMRLWQTRLSEDTRPYPGRHAVLGTEVIPAAVLLTTFLAAAEQAGHPSMLGDVSLQVPVVATVPRDLQLVEQARQLRLSSQPTGEGDEESWLTHCTAAVTTPDQGGVTPAADHVDLTTWREHCHAELETACVLDRLVTVGVNGIGFPWRVDALRRGDGFLTATVTADPQQTEKNTWASLFDAALSVAPVLFGEPAVLRMPGTFREVVTLGEAPAQAVIGVRLAASTAGQTAVVVDIEIASLSGSVLARLTGTAFGAVEHTPDAASATVAAPPHATPEYSGLDREELLTHLTRVVGGVVAEELRMPAEELGIRRPVTELGVDSLMTAVIIRRLRRTFQVALPDTLLWNRPTVHAIARHLADLLPGQQA